MWRPEYHRLFAVAETVAPLTHCDQEVLLFDSVFQILSLVWELEYALWLPEVLDPCRRNSHPTTKEVIS